MAYYLTYDEYVALLVKVVPESFRDGHRWHPEDLGSAIDFANESLAKTLELLEER